MTADSQAQAGSPASGAGKPAGPAAVTLRLEPVTLSKKEGWFRLGNGGTYVVIRRGKSGDKVTVIENGRVTQSYLVSGNLGCSSVQVLVSGVDVCQPLSQILRDYDLLVEQYELEQRAGALEVTGTVVLSLPSEWEQLVYNISRMVMEHRVVKAFYVRQGNREVLLGIYCYEDGYYWECGETLKKEVEDLSSGSALLDSKIVPGLRGNIIRKIEGKTLTPYEPAKGCLVFKDKVFCWEPFLQSKDLEKALRPPSPDLVVTHRIPWRIRPELYKRVRPGLMKYIPPQNANDLIELFKGLSPKSFKAFLDWVKHPGEKEEEAYPRVVLLLEIIGYTLYPHGYPFHKAVLLTGRGANGKTTYLRLIETILGKENIAAVDMTSLDPKVDRFSAADLWNKLANISSEPPKGRSFDPELFKKLTGEDLVRFENKYRNAFTDRNYAKMIFSANELPKVTEDTYAFWRRWIVVEFPNRFPPNPRFFEETFTDEEVEGIVICSLHAFRLVMERGGFTEQGARDPREEWLSRSNPVYQVIKRMVDDGLITFDPQGFIIKSDLYQLYKRYADMIGVDEGEAVRVLEQKDFTRHLTRFFQVRARDKRVGGKVRHVYVGVRIKDYAKAAALVNGLETPADLTHFMEDSNAASQ